MAPGRSGTPTDTGTFPNLNIPQRAATTQLTPEETEAQLASLRAAAQQQQSPAGEAESAEARRKRLQVLQAEQAETLRVIESE